jgi:hypothetical protein
MGLTCDAKRSVALPNTRRRVLDKISIMICARTRPLRLSGEPASHMLATRQHALTAPLRHDGLNSRVGARPGNFPHLDKLGYPIFFGPARLDQIPDVARRIIVGVEAFGFGCAGTEASSGRMALRSPTSMGVGMDLHAPGNDDRVRNRGRSDCADPADAQTDGNSGGTASDEVGGQACGVRRVVSTVRRGRANTHPRSGSPWRLPVAGPICTAVATVHVACEPVRSRGFGARLLPG